MTDTTGGGETRPLKEIALDLQNAVIRIDSAYITYSADHRTVLGREADVLDKLRKELEALRND